MSCKDTGVCKSAAACFLGGCIYERRTAEAQAADVGELPPLPVRMPSYDKDGKQTKAGYTADQMRDYARAALKGQPK
jgi:hypothetical protein